MDSLAKKESDIIGKTEIQDIKLHLIGILSLLLQYWKVRVLVLGRENCLRLHPCWVLTIFDLLIF